MAERKSLGRGLGALLNEDFSTETKISKDEEKGAVEVAIERVVRNVNQPRKIFDESAMLELVNSIRTHGIITPIIVVKRGDDNYMIIAGERRWRAAKKAGLRTVPVIVRDYNDKQVKEISLIENLQREDLNPIETAKAIRQLMDDYSYTQEQASDRIGKSRSSVANLLGLLTLDDRVMILIEGNRLSAGHAKVLTSVADKDVQYALALKGADGKLSVRAFESLVRSKKEMIDKPAGSEPQVSLELNHLVQTMQRAFATKVSVVGNDKKGRIYIDYYTRDDIDRIVELLKLIEKN